MRITEWLFYAQLPWSSMNIDLVMECTGLFTKREAAAKRSATKQLAQQQSARRKLSRKRGGGFGFLGTVVLAGGALPRRSRSDRWRRHRRDEWRGARPASASPLLEHARRWR